MAIDVILKYFPNLTDRQIAQFETLGREYPLWNSRINVISRKDIDNLYTNHVLHSLAISKFLHEVSPGTTFMDLGTGGGFPGIPLAIVYPEARFHLIDRINKKLTVAKAVSEAAGISNVTFQHGDVGECHSKFNYVVSRAVMRLDSLVGLVRSNIDRHSSENLYANGLICLKGGNLEEEISGVKMPLIDEPLSVYFNEPYFETKSLLYIPFK